MLTKDDITAAYRLLLGRLPESEATIDMQIETNEDLVKLRHSLLTSDEFLNNLQADAVLQGALSPANEIMNTVKSIKQRQNGRRLLGFRSTSSH